MRSAIVIILALWLCGCSAKREAAVRQSEQAQKVAVSEVSAQVERASVSSFEAASANLELSADSAILPDGTRLYGARLTAKADKPKAAEEVRESAKEQRSDSAFAEESAAIEAEQKSESGQPSRWRGWLIAIGALAIALWLIWKRRSSVFHV